MELFFTYDKSGNPLGRKVITLPKTLFGVLAVDLNEGRYLELAHVLRGEVIVSGEIRADEDALQDALLEFVEEYPKRLFEERLAEFVATNNPSPLGLAVFAQKLAESLGLRVDDLADRLAGEQLDLLEEAAE